MLACKNIYIYVAVNLLMLLFLKKKGFDDVVVKLLGSAHNLVPTYFFSLIY